MFPISGSVQSSTVRGRAVGIIAIEVADRTSHTLRQHPTINVERQRERRGGPVVPAGMEALQLDAVADAVDVVVLILLRLVRRDGVREQPFTRSYSEAIASMKAEMARRTCR
jgi:hypothetical protein